jgi:DnaJ-class molecular chaperone
VACEKCEGTGRVPWKPTGGLAVLGSETQPCPDCQGSGVANQEWRPLSELEDRFARRFGKSS